MSREGVTQGKPSSSPRFCIAWHKFVRRFGAKLRAADGLGIFGMDDGYGVGPPAVVFEAVLEFIREVEEHCGLKCQRDKCEVFSWD